MGIREKNEKSFEPGRGYSRQDWDEVSDNPSVTAEELAAMRPLREVIPETADAIEREITLRGRPPADKPKQG
jgi:hypothetical protein